MKDGSLSGTVYQKSYKKAFEYYFGPKGQMRAGGDGILYLWCTCTANHRRRVTALAATCTTLTSPSPSKIKFRAWSWLSGLQNGLDACPACACMWCACLVKMKTSRKSLLPAAIRYAHVATNNHGCTCLSSTRLRPFPALRLFRALLAVFARTLLTLRALFLVFLLLVSSLHLLHLDVMPRAFPEARQGYDHDYS